MALLRLGESVMARGWTATSATMSRGRTDGRRPRRRGDVTRPVPPESQRVVGRLIAETIGGDAVTHAYYDEPEPHVVSVLKAT